MIFTLAKEYNLYPCENCGRKYHARVLKFHLNECYKHSCLQCDQQFTDKRNLLIHKTSSHNNDKYQCAICEKSFNQKSALMIHISYDHEGTVSLITLYYICNK